MRPRERRLLALTLLAGATAASRSALAQDDFTVGALPPAKPPAPFYENHVELGGGYQSLSSYYFARYGGNPGDGLFPLVDAEFGGRDAWDSSGTKFWNAAVEANGNDRLVLSARFGSQGRWLAQASYDDFTRYYTESAMTPFLGTGTTQLSLPTNWISGGSSLQFRNLTADLQPLALKTRWQTVDGDILAKPWNGYEFRIHVEERDRNGLFGQYLAFGQEANYPVGVFFPEPIDYHSTRLTPSFGFNNGRVQWTLSYSLALFDDGQTSVFVPNPYNRSLGTPWTAGAFAGYPLSMGQYSLPPSNSANQFSFASSYNLTPATHITARLTYTIEAQNVPFLPYTPSTQLFVPIPLPQSSLHGLVDKTFASFGVTSRLTPKLELTANYTYDDRDDRTPQNVYSYIANDAEDQPQPVIPGESSHIRINLPHSYTFQHAKIDLSYRPASNWRLSLSYAGDFDRRTDQEVANTAEHTLLAKAQVNFEQASVWASYSFASRMGSIYEDFLPWNLSHTQAYLNFSPADQSIQYPLLRMYNLADRLREEAKTGATATITDALSVDLSGGYASNNYIHSLIGLRSSDSLLLDSDASYVMGPLTASAFYSFEHQATDQAGYFIASTTLTNPAQDWGAQNIDNTHTVGVKADWQAIPHKLKIGTSYTLSYGTTNIPVETTAFIPLAQNAPLPTAKEITHTANVHFEYAFKPGLSLRAGYKFERHISDDWSYTGGLTPVTQILGSGELPPRYTAHVLWMSARYDF